jgi:hypothetical protein
MESECMDSAIAAHGTKVQETRFNMQVDEWDHVPSGCSVQFKGDWAVHYNRKVGIVGPIPSTYTVVPYDAGVNGWHSCIGLASGMIPEFFARVSKINDVLGFEVCWGKDYGTKIQASADATGTSAAVKVSGYIRWMKNVIPWTEGGPTSLFRRSQENDRNGQPAHSRDEYLQGD